MLRDTNEVREYISSKFGKVYLLNDAGHREKHFESVEKCGLEINERLDLGVDPFLIMLVAWFHDLFAWKREVHHTLAQRWVEWGPDPVFKLLTSKEQEMVAHACGEHRATYKGEYFSILSELGSAADRGNPNRTAEGYVERSVQYNLAKGFSLEEAQVNAVEHIKKKVGRGGYARYNDLYLRAFKEDLERLWDKIDLL